MAFKGNIKEFSLIDVIQLICQSSKTGILQVETDNFNAKVFIKEGKLIDVKADTETFDFKLGNYLVSRGIISENDLEVYLEKQKKMPIRLGQLLIDDNVVTNETLKKLYTEHIKSNFEKILALEKGKYEFVPSVVEYNTDEVMPISIDSILLDTLKNIDEIKLFKTKIKSLSLIYKKVEKDLYIAFDNKVTSKDEPVVVKKNRVFFNSDAQIVFNFIDGHNTIQKIISKSALDEFYILKIIYLLIENNLIELSTTEKETVQSKKINLVNVLVGLVSFAILVTLTFFVSKKLLSVKITYNAKFIEYQKERMNEYKSELISISNIYHNNNNYKDLKLFYQNERVFK